MVLEHARVVFNTFSETITMAECRHNSCQPFTPCAKERKIDHNHEHKIRPHSNLKSPSLSHSSTQPNIPMTQIIPAVESILSIFPRLDPGALISIIQRDFRAEDLTRLLSPQTRKRPEKTLSGAAATAAGRTLLANFSTPTHFLSAWLVYSSARTLLENHSGATGASLNAYANTLLEFAKQYEWGAVLDYHAEFFADRIEEEREGSEKADPRAWVHEDERLIQKHLYPHPLLRSPSLPWSWRHSGRVNRRSSSSSSDVSTSTSTSSFSSREGEKNPVSKGTSGHQNEPHVKGLDDMPRSFAVKELSSPVRREVQFICFC
jgi:hypothetical protein